MSSTTKSNTGKVYPFDYVPKKVLKKELSKLLVKEICEKQNCELCEALNELGELIKDRYEYTNKIRDKLGECFCH